MLLLILTLWLALELELEWCSRMTMTPGTTRAPHHLKEAGGWPWPSLARLADANGHSKCQRGKILDDEQCQVEVDGDNIHETGIVSAEIPKTRHLEQTTDRIGRGRYNFSISVQDRPPPLPSALLLRLLLLSQILFYMGAA
jgi:hypothetical protein